MQEQLAIGVDVGATKIAAVLADINGNVLATEQAATTASAGTAAVVNRIATAVEHLLQQTDQPVLGIGLGTPGYVDRSAGIVRNAVNMGWIEVPLVELVIDRIFQKTRRNLPVWVENDANIQTLAEHLFGAAQGADIGIHVAIGSGLGSGIMVNGQLVSGATFAAAEMGHLSLDPENGRLCACGLRGCIETVVSGPGAVHTARELLAGEHATTELRDDASLSAEALLAALHQEDPLAQAVFTKTAEWLGIALAVYVSVLNPAVVTIGGGFGLAAFSYLEPVARQEMSRRVLPQSYGRTQILRSQVNSTALGGAALVWYAQQQKETSA